MCGSEAFFHKERSTPSQLPELSVKAFIYVLPSSSLFPYWNDVTN